MILFTRSLHLIRCLFPAIGAMASALAAQDPVDQVNPFIGTGGHGHTFPGATLPFGLVQLSPDTRVHDWDACAGYHYSDKTIIGFSHTHLSGTGIREYGTILVLPLTGDLIQGKEAKPLDAKRFASAFSHDNETANPGYYQVFLDSYKIDAELTATTRAGMHRYTFPASDNGHFLVDLVHGLENFPIEATLNVESNTVLSGHRRSNGWAKDVTVYFVMEFSKPFDAITLEQDGKLLEAGSKNASGKNLRAVADYKTTEGQKILVRVGISPTSVEEARKNLRAEISSWDFDAVKASARKTWNDQLERLTIENPDSNIREIFYTALYHTMLSPSLYNNADGSYRGPDGKTHEYEGFQFYSTFSLWDTFRAVHPLLTLIQPERIDDFVQSLLVFYKQSPKGILPKWALAHYDTGTMIGYHSVPVIWDAYAKGFRGFDSSLALEAMITTAMDNGNRQDEYRSLGYIPWVEGKTKATASTLEFAYDDWCIAEMAKALGKEEEAGIYAKRAQNYRNVWDEKYRFFRSKNADGSYKEPFEPREVSGRGTSANGYFVEANAWHYAFFVPHDVPGMISLYGGREKFVKRLDEFFNQDSAILHRGLDITGLIGQYAHGNEPCHHVAYLYALAGAQYKTARRVREILYTQYDATPAGLVGNDDCGQISAWYVFSAVGLYPLNPADGRYIIGSPLMEKTVIQLDPKFYPGKTFTILAKNVSRLNGYVKSAKLNGVELTRPWVTHEEISRGGTLELDMDILPNKAFGANSSGEVANN